MSKQDGKQVIARAMASAFATVENSGNIVETCLKEASKFYGEQAIPSKDLKFITDSVAVLREWEGDTAKVRKSECRAILSQHVALPAAIASFRSKSATCDWRDALRLARYLRKAKGNVKAAVATAVEANASKGEPKKLTPKMAKGRATAAMNLLMKLPHMPSEFKAAIRKAAKASGFVLNVERA